MTTTVPSVTTPPATTPSRDMTDEAFVAAGNAWVAWEAQAFGEDLPATVAAMNTAGVEVTANTAAAAASATAASAAEAAVVAGTDYFATSTTSLSIANSGSKAFTTQAGKSFAATGDRVTAISRGTPTARMRGVVTYSGTTLTMTPDEATGSGTYTDWMLILSALESVLPIGRQAIWIPAVAMVARATNGPAAGSIETTTNKQNLRTLDFDASTKQYAQVRIRMPKSWNEGTISVAPVWWHPSTSTNFKVSWAAQAVAVSDGDALDAAFGTAQISNDLGGTTDTLYVGPETSAITIAGAPAAEDVVTLQVYRVADDAVNDTLAVNARLHGVMLYITTDAGNDV